MTKKAEEAKEKRRKGIKRFFEEFGKFITRGNVLDLAVGVIVGSAFTGIVNALSNNILKPIINWLLALILGEDSLTGIFTYLKKVETDGAIDLTKSIYIDWGAFINAAINFLLIAFVLFCIVKTINKVIEARDKMISDFDLPKKKKIAEYRKSGLTKREAIARCEAERKAAEEQKKAEEEAAKQAEAERKAEEERKASQNTRLLEKIVELLEENKQK
ncbi:MAG: large conductance mechanosensitive channel protein MscL [Candidatus Borkfalkiaceae bacterium]|nr:large conductance mechanosensitive channel protein MscL [Clostridia bacterium]MDY6223194.1 large conductance mechanosensitive channel protein MscL [Christensenellaceae bacterium]